MKYVKIEMTLMDHKDPFVRAIYCWQSSHNLAWLKLEVPKLLKLYKKYDVNKIKQKYIYRCMSISNKTLKKLKENGSVVLSPKLKLSSWSLSKTYIKNRCRKLKNAFHIAVKKEVKPGNVIVNIPDIYKKFNLINEYDKGQEVIILNSPYYLTISLKDVVSMKANTIPKGIDWANTLARDERKFLKKHPEMKKLKSILNKHKKGYIIYRKEPDLDEILSRGIYKSAKGSKIKRMGPNQCHKNSARLFITNPNRYSIYTGWVVDTDFSLNVWRQHSWIYDNKDGKIVETIAKRKGYFGFKLTKREAKQFVKREGFTI